MRSILVHLIKERTCKIAGYFICKKSKSKNKIHFKKNVIQGNGQTYNKSNTTLSGLTKMIIAPGLGENNALTFRVCALFLSSPRAIILFAWPLLVISYCT